MLIIISSSLIFVVTSISPCFIVKSLKFRKFFVQNGSFSFVYREISFSIVSELYGLKFHICFLLYDQNQ